MVFKKLKRKILELLFIVLYNIKVKIIPHIESEIRILIYKTQEKIDPSPAKKKNESDFDWYKRVNVKYALRHAKFSFLQLRNLENGTFYALKFKGLDQYPKKVQKSYKELAVLISARAREYEQHYNNLLSKVDLQQNN